MGANNSRPPSPVDPNAFASLIGSDGKFNQADIPNLFSGGMMPLLMAARGQAQPGMGQGMGMGPPSGQAGSSPFQRPMMQAWQQQYDRRPISPVTRALMR